MQKIQGLISKTIVCLLVGIFILIINSKSIARGVSSADPNIQKVFGVSSSSISTIPRAVFVKALFENTTRVPFSKNNTCYQDIGSLNKNTRRAICSLHEHGIFGTQKISKFRPHAATTWEFAVITACKTQNWVKKPSHSSCFKYGKETGLTLKGRSRTVTYSEGLNLFSRLKNVVQTEKNKNSTEVKATSPSLPPSAQQIASSPLSSFTIPQREPIPPLSFTPVSGSAISTDFFENIRLSEPLPSIFYKDQVYFVEGDISVASEENIFIFLCKENIECSTNSEKFAEKTSGTHFKIPVYFKETGNFQIGIIPGFEGRSNTRTVSVLPDVSTLANGGLVSSRLDVSYSEGKTTFSWDPNSSLPVRLIIFQGEKRRDYLLNQAVSSFSPASRDFASFSPGEAGMTIENNGVPGPVKKLSLLTQEFFKIDKKAIEDVSFIDRLATPGTFEFSGHSLSTISKKAAITLPTGLVEEFEFNTSDISAGKSIRIEKTFLSPGTYIFELNTPQGAAVVNIPIYVGDSGTPLLPDIFAIMPALLDKNPVNLSDARATMLRLINKDRASQGLPALLLWDSLSAVAQGHSEDMVARNFFSHVNPDGKSPENRRRAAKIPVAIRENLGKGSGLDLIEAGLMRSPIHRNAIIDPEIKRVGIGVAKNADGYIFITQNFSSDPFTSTDISNLEEKFFTIGNEERSKRAHSALRHDSLLRGIAQRWARRMAAEDFLGGQSPDGTSLTQVMRNEGVNSAIRFHFVEANDITRLKEEFIKQGGLIDPTNVSIGIGIATTELGDIFMLTIYTP